MSDLLPYIGAIGSACVVITTIIVNYFNRRRNNENQIIEVLEQIIPTPNIDPPPPPSIPHSKSYNDMKSFYNELKRRRTNSNSPPRMESLDI